MKVFLRFLRENRLFFLLTLLAPALFLLIFGLYGYPAGVFLYALLLYGLAFLLVWGCAFAQWRRRSRERAEYLKTVENGAADSGCPDTRADEDYREALRACSEKVRELTQTALRERQEAQDYYTLWVHQIKTPIAAMRLRLQEEDHPARVLLENELFRVELYAEMALQYIRLENAPNDLDFRSCPLDDVIRGCIRKFAPLFIAKKLRIRYAGTDAVVLTDGKWLSFILEQLFSNAVKYTPSGSVSVEVTEDKRLIVRDTGIGIAPEDLPRVFEKGFTGHNGRIDQKATGLGLYLCALAARRLGIGIGAESTPGHGSAFTLTLDKKPQRPD